MRKPHRWLYHFLVLVLAQTELQQAVELLQKGDYPAAILRLRKLTAAAPSSAPALKLLAKALLLGGDRLEPEGLLRRLTEPEEHFLVTADGLGVVVRGFAKGKLRRLADETVRVTGRFGFDAAGGTYIEADGVAPVQ